MPSAREWDLRGTPRSLPATVASWCARAALLALLVLVHCAAQAEAGREEAARAVAESWLPVVDAGRYAESWALLVVPLREKVPRDTWVRDLTAQREFLGSLVSRTLVGARFAARLPDAPDGDYVVVQYRSEFARGGTILETVVPMLDVDGNWRVAGYFVRRDL